MQFEFTTISKHLDTLKKEKSELLKLWISSKDVQNTLFHHGITPEYFSKYFGSKVVDYALGVAEGKNKLGNCPVIGVMLIFFEKKNIPLEDIFIICVHLKNSIIDYALEAKLLNQALLSEICTLIDHNFFGMIQEYLHLHYNSEIEYKSCNLFTHTAPNPAPTMVSLRLINAFQYIQEIDIDQDVLHELAELEEETLRSLDLTEGISNTINREIIDLFTQYAKMIDRLMDFQELSYSLWILIDILKSIDLVNFQDESTCLAIYTKAIINDLSAWRISVFVNQSAEDIHYLDKTLLSSITQLQIMLSPQNCDQVDEIEFF